MSKLSPAAEGVRIHKFWRAAGMGLPVDVSLLAPELSRNAPDPITKVTGQDLDGIDGVLYKRRKKGDWYILFDANVDVPGRTNFTIAHELGHYVLHRNWHQEFRCGQADLLDYESKESRRREAEANRFASYLLMPADDLREQVGRESMSISLIDHLAHRYQVSFTAAALRWVELTEEVVLVAVARDDFVLWSYPSKSARSLKAYLPPGTPVPPPALERLQRTRMVNERIRVPPEIWHPRFEAEESIIASDRFDMAIFLVRFPLAKMTEHEEEREQDMVSGLTELSAGLGWRK